MTTAKHGDTAGKPPAPKELQNPLEFVRTGLEAAKGGAPQMYVWAGGSIFALAGVLMPSLVGVGQAFYALVTFGIATIALGILVFLAAKYTVTFQIQRDWRVIQQPLRGEKLEDLDKKLETLRTVAADAFKKSLGTEVKDNVRANIFVVDYRRATEGVGIELRMPAQFRIKMDDPREWDLAFQPGRGATGEAFSSAQVVLTTDRLYGVPPALRDVYDKLIIADLKGIISLPILDSERSNVIAVLNVDICLIEVAHKDLNTVYEAIRRNGNFKDLEDSLNRVDKAWLTIGLRKG